MNGIQREISTTYVCPESVIERVELFSRKLVLQLQSMVVRDVCELVERVGVVDVQFELSLGVRSGCVGVDDGAEVGDGVIGSN